MRLSVNDIAVEVADGATVLDAVRAAGAVVPTLCYDERLTPQGSCRVCLVGVRGRAMPACTTPATDGMEINTGDETARRAARLALELLVS